MRQRQNFWIVSFCCHREQILQPSLKRTWWNVWKSGGSTTYLYMLKDKKKHWLCTTTWILHDVLVRTKKSSVHKGLKSMMSWPATAVVAYFNIFPSDVLSPVQMLKQAWMLFHTVFNTTKERNQRMMGNEKGHKLCRKIRLYGNL